MRVVSDKELVKDTIHDLFVKLWNHKANLGEVTAIRSYLLVSLRSTLYNKVRQGSRMVVTELNESLPFEMVFSVESEFIKKENQSVQTQKLIEALNQLTARQKEVIYLRYFEEMEYEEIAGIMNITVKATYKLTARGLDALRQILDVSPSSLILFLALAKADLFNWQAVIC
jgi:RNA polymerase sigma factor (sigma-70 family)